MRYRYVLYHGGGMSIISHESYETAQIALNHGKYFLSKARDAVRVVVIDNRGTELLRYDKEKKK